MQKFVLSRRHLIFFSLLLSTLLLGCDSPPEATATAIPPSKPEIVLPLNESEFVESDLLLQWNWPELQEGQLFVLRVWFGEESPQEIWTQERSFNAKGLIDAYSRDIGVYHWQVAIVNTTAEGGFESMGSEWSDLQTLHRVRRLSLEPLPEDQLSETARFIASQGFTNATELIDFTRSWMVQNTLIGEELSIYAPDYSDAAEMMYKHSLGEGEAPQMYCNGISTTMLTVLRELGIESRLIFLYGEIPGWFNEHTVLEVFNPDTQAWEIHDGTIDAYFVDAETNARIPATRIIYSPLNSIAGCTSEGCNSESNIEKFRTRSGALRYGFSTEIWVNPERMDMARRVEAFENQNFAEFIAAQAGVPVRQLIFHFDTVE